MRISLLITMTVVMTSALLTPFLHARDRKSTYELVLSGKTCKERTNQQIDCDYKVGLSLHISIAGIGLPDTAVTFMKSSFDGDFYASFGLMHGCVIVKRGKKGVQESRLEGPGSFQDYAFISPKNGKIYQTWEKCQMGM